MAKNFGFESLLKNTSKGTNSNNGDITTNISWSPFNNRNNNNNNRNNNNRLRGLNGLSGLKLGKDKNDDNQKSSTSNNNKPNLQKTAKANKNELEMAVVDDFINDCSTNKTNAEALFKIIVTGFVPVTTTVLRVAKNNPKPEDLKVINAFIDIMSTKVFSTSLLSLLKDNAFDNLDTNLIGAVIALALNTSADKMREDTISVYVEIVSEYLYKNTIEDMVTEFGISEDMAIDLVIAFPYLGEDWMEPDRKEVAGEFIRVILDHYQTTIKVMDKDNMNKLFYYIFPERADDEGNMNLQALKTIGQCLSFEYIELENDEQKQLYEQYVMFLYESLDEYDIVDIKTALRFVNREIQNNMKLKRDMPLIYNPDVAANYTNVYKAINDLVHKSDAFASLM